METFRSEALNEIAGHGLETGRYCQDATVGSGTSGRMQRFKDDIHDIHVICVYICMNIMNIDIGIYVDHIFFSQLLAVLSNS